MVRAGGSTSLPGEGSCYRAAEYLQLALLWVCVYCFLMGRPTSGTYLLRTLLGGCGLDRSLPRPACNPALWLTPRQSPLRCEALDVGVVSKLLHQEVHLVAGVGHLLWVGSRQGAEPAKDLSVLATVLSMSFTQLSLGTHTHTHMGVVAGIASNTGLGWEFEPQSSSKQARNPLLHILSG